MAKQDQQTNQTDDYYSELFNLAALFEEPPARQGSRGPKTGTTMIISQNLRGFAQDSRRHWMRGWRRRRGRRPPDIVLVQETNLSSQDDETEMQNEWTRAWQLKTTEHPMSYWASITTGIAGVGILVSPEISERVNPWQQSSWTSRVMAVEFDDWVIVNVYAPAGADKKQEREQFFQDLEPWISRHSSIVLGGDFNCVLNPAKDRVTNRRAAKGTTESPELSRVISSRYLTDAITLIHHIDDEEEEIDPLHHYSYWARDGASRLDRFYVKGEPYSQTQWVTAESPANDSDHQEVCLELYAGGNDHHRRQNGIQYPIKTGRPERVRIAIAEGLVDLMTEFEKKRQPDRIVGWSSTRHTTTSKTSEIR